MGLRVKPAYPWGQPYTHHQALPLKLGGRVLGTPQKTGGKGEDRDKGTCGEILWGLGTGATDTALKMDFDWPP
jgi:hypothetical protein